MARKISVEIVGDTSSLERALGRSGKQLSKWQQGLQTAAKWSGRAFLVMGAGAIKATRDASHLNEMVSATRVVFGKSAKEILDWSKNTQDALSQADFLSAAKGFAVFARQAGLGDEATAKFSKTLLDGANDLASFHDANPADVLADIKSGLTGEAEPLRKYGILLSEAAVQQEAMRMGLVKGKQPLTERQKVLARQHLILSQLGAAQGDWNRTRDSAANKERQQMANAKDMSAQLGQVLLPAYQKLLSVGIRVTKWMSENQGVTKVLIGILAGMAAAIWLVNFALAANPIVLVIIAIAALGVALVVLWAKFETFRDIVRAVWGWIKNHWPLLLAIIAGPIGVAVGLVIQHFDAIKGTVTGVVRWIRGRWNALVGFIGGLPERITTAASGMWTGIVRAFKTALNAIIGLWNQLSIPGFTIPGPGPLPSIHVPGVDIPNIPTLDRGGIVPGRRGAPTLAVVHGGETVLPTHRAVGGGGAVYNFSFPNYVGDKRELMDVIRREVAIHRRNNGGRDPF